MKIPAINRCKSELGSTMIEFSLVGFMFIMVLLGVVEMARMVLVYTTVANAARAGARYAIVHGSDRTASGVDGPSGPGSVTQVQTVVTNFASAGLLDLSRLTVTVAYPNGTNTPGSSVSVTTSYTYDPLVTFFTSILGTTMGSKSQGVITF